MTGRFVHPNRRTRAGGMAALAIAAAYLVIIGLYAAVGAPPTGGEAWLEYLADKAGQWWWIVGLSVLTNLLYVPVALALHAVLGELDRMAMAVAVSFIGLFVALELATNWTGIGALLVLSSDYAAATSEAQRAMLVSAASFPSAMLESPLAAVYAIGTLSLAFLIVGFVMLRSAFGRLASYVGIVTGILGIVAVMGVDIAVIANAVFATLWLLLVGLRLVRHA